MPVFLSSPQRPFMPQEFETAKTSGIQQIRKGLPLDPKSHTLTAISGTVLEPLWRGKKSERPKHKIQAPNFNSSYRSKSLSGGEVAKRYPNILLFEMGHLWGPGFGDEAFAGMMWVPREVNQFLQGPLEDRIRELYEDTKHGSNVEIVASVQSWNEENMITEFARAIDYRVTVDGPDNYHEFYEINIKTLAPGSPIVTELEGTLLK